MESTKTVADEIYPSINIAFELALSEYNTLNKNFESTKKYSQIILVWIVAVSAFIIKATLDVRSESFNKAMLDVMNSPTVPTLLLNFLIGTSLGAVLFPLFFLRLELLNLHFLEMKTLNLTEEKFKIMVIQDMHRILKINRSKISFAKFLNGAGIILFIFFLAALSLKFRLYTL